MPIGPRGTSAIAKITMNILDRKFKLRLEVLKIETKLLIRYIDDVRVILERIRLGSVIRGDRVEIDQEQMVLDSQLADPEVEVTARILKEVMNTLVDGIVFTTETRADFTREWTQCSGWKRLRLAADVGWPTNSTRNR